MLQPPIQLRDHVFTRVHIEANNIELPEDVLKNELPFGYNFTFTCEVVEIDSDDRFFKVELNITSQEKKDYIQGYSVDVTVAGLFNVEKNVPEEEVPKMLAILAPALLLGPAREFIYTVTGRGPCKAVYLPTVNFTSPPDEQKSEKKPRKKTAKKKSAPKKK